MHLLRPALRWDVDDGRGVAAPAGRTGDSDARGRMGRVRDRVWAVGGRDRRWASTREHGTSATTEEAHRAAVAA